MSSEEVDSQHPLALEARRLTEILEKETATDINAFLILGQGGITVMEALTSHQPKEFLPKLIEVMADALAQKIPDEVPAEAVIK